MNVSMRGESICTRRENRDGDRRDFLCSRRWRIIEIFFNHHANCFVARVNGVGFFIKYNGSGSPYLDCRRTSSSKKTASCLVLTKWWGDPCDHPEFINMHRENMQITHGNKSD